MVLLLLGLAHSGIPADAPARAVAPVQRLQGLAPGRLRFGSFLAGQGHLRQRLRHDARALQRSYQRQQHRLQPCRVRPARAIAIRRAAQPSRLGHLLTGRLVGFGDRFRLLLRQRFGRPWPGADEIAAGPELAEGRVGVHGTSFPGAVRDHVLATDATHQPSIGNGGISYLGFVCITSLC